MTNQTEAALAAVAEAHADTRRSVVAKTYKVKYAERAVTARGKKGLSKRVVADSCGDWLALELGFLVRPNPKKPMDYPRLSAIVEANGLSLAKWQHLNVGQQRMLVALALRPVVAEAGVLMLDDGTELKAPRSYCERYAR